MNLTIVKDRLVYPHKRSALKYLLRNPSLVLSVLSGKPSRFFMSRTLGKVVDQNISPQVFKTLCERSLNWANEQGLKDPTGELTLLYLIVRQYKPDIVVETGVAHGASSAFMLCALHENGKGHLYSIDLPPYVTPAEIENTDQGAIHTMEDGQKHRINDAYTVGDSVPQYLRDRWTLVLGDAKSELPKLLKDAGKVSIFLHDSLHTCEHMLFEYATAWPHIEEGGLLLSHDVLWNEAFLMFSQRVGSRPSIYRNLGAIKK